MSILLVSTSVDSATDRVEKKLACITDEKVFRLNTEDMPYTSSISVYYSSAESAWFSIASSMGQLDSRSIRSVWYRRIRRAVCPGGVDSLLHQYVSNETVWALNGTLNILNHDKVKWLNSPRFIALAENKVFQLSLAKQIGFVIPQTLISSSSEDIITFSKRYKSTIVKPVRSGYIETKEGAFAAYTRRLTEEDIESLRTNVLPAPLIVQEEIKKKYDIRVTVIGNDLFAARIHSQGDPSAIVDWRRTENPDLKHTKVLLPNSIRNKCLKIHKALNLEYSAIDFVETKDGRFIFLEVNPGGQWLWIENQLNYPITLRIAEYLANE